MDDREMQNLIERYVRAYNDFDIEGMVALLHPDCSFRNVSGGTVNASTSGIPEIRELVEKSRELFSSRRQVITSFKRDGDAMAVEIDFDAVLKADNPDSPNAGETLKMHGRSVFRIRDGLILALTDYS